MSCSGADGTDGCGEGMKKIKTWREEDDGSKDSIDKLDEVITCYNAVVEWINEHEKGRDPVLK